MTKGKPKNPVWNELLILERKLVLIRNTFYASDSDNGRRVKYNRAIALLRESIEEVHSLRQKVRKK